MAAKPWNVVNLELPVGDKTYVVTPIGYREGLTLIATMSDDAEKQKEGLGAAASAEELYRHCMGATWDEMLEDGCPYPVLERAGTAATQYQTSLVVYGQDCETAAKLAEQVWEEGLLPEAVAAAMAAKQRREGQAKGKTSTPSTSTAAGRKTPSPASTSGMKRPPATRRSTSTTGQAKRPRSTGAQSRSAGRSS